MTRGILSSTARDTYRNYDLGTRSTLFVCGAFAMGTLREQLLQLDAVVVANLVPNNDICQLVDEIGECLATSSCKGQMARSISLGDCDGSLRGEFQSLFVKSVDVNLVHP